MKGLFIPEVMTGLSADDAGVGAENESKHRVFAIMHQRDAGK
jgi:hypothetical protein